MKNKVIVANLKMTMSLDEVITYLKLVNQVYNDRLIICPTSIYVPYFLKNGYQVGLQNIYCDGNYTGEISPKQAYDIGIRSVIVGHSDRRIHFLEKDTDINAKVLASIRQGLHVILCIGETKEEKEMLKTDRILKYQLLEALKNVDEFDQITIAYEPVWAIGTSITPKLREIEVTTHYIKQIVEKNYLYEDIPVIYGGSVNEKNISDILNLKELSGVIVGSSASQIQNFMKLLEVTLEK